MEKLESLISIPFLHPVRTAVRSRSARLRRVRRPVSVSRRRSRRQAPAASLAPRRRTTAGPLATQAPDVCGWRWRVLRIQYFVLFVWNLVPSDACGRSATVVPAAVARNARRPAGTVTAGIRGAPPSGRAGARRHPDVGRGGRARSRAGTAGPAVPMWSLVVHQARTLRAPTPDVAIDTPVSSAAARSGVRPSAPVAEPVTPQTALVELEAQRRVGRSRSSRSSSCLALA